MGRRNILEPSAIFIPLLKPEINIQDNEDIDINPYLEKTGDNKNMGRIHLPTERRYYCPGDFEYGGSSN